MRILITGGAGCLGTNLIDQYLPRGHQVLVIDNYATSAPEVLPQHDALQVVEGSVSDAALVDAAMAEFRPTHVIHAAASYKDPADWHGDAEVNVTGSLNVLRAAERAGVKRFVNLQTALCYGRPSTVPIPVDHPTAPFTSYGISKTAGEQYVLMSELPVVSLRLANIVSPRLSIGPIPTFYTRLKAGKGCFCSDTYRDFLDIADFVDLMDIVMAEGAPTGVFNVSTGESKSIKDLFDQVVAHLGVELPEPVPIVPPGDDDVPAVVLDPSASNAALGWQAKIGFEEMMSRMLAWYDANGVRQIYSHLSAPAALKE
ncbi:MAG: NAD-dependent epimerase/dehydratase family protein [Pseudomonadota bacterium]